MPGVPGSRRQGIGDLEVVLAPTVWDERQKRGHSGASFLIIGFTLFIIIGFAETV